ncbi:MAG: peptide-methionine (R)-S-oxide reductase MsrB [Pseudomonadota bacterium]|nr:peptide-methionine (R)-S-oxide reductase MsrB [Pseudomonadota bacterium]
MKRRKLLQALLAAAALPLVPACARVGGEAGPAGSAVGSSAGGSAASGSEIPVLAHPDSYWRDKVSPAAFAVLFDEDTERAFSSPLDREKREGTFVCSACYLPLFDSAAKFDSGTGWPSFTRPISAARVGTKRDFLMLMPRTEYHCARCGGHQGHIFDDGPPPLGKRWCNNGLALAFVPRAQALPQLRG